jgi:hypothetical protein
MARKLAVLFDFHRGIRSFYAAGRFDELSRGCVSCLLNANFRKRFPQRHNSIFYAKIDDHGIRRGDTGPTVASRVALDLLYWTMRLAPYTPYRLIRMAIEMARKADPFFLSSILCLP